MGLSPSFGEDEMGQIGAFPGASDFINGLLGAESENPLSEPESDFRFPSSDS